MAFVDNESCSHCGTAKVEIPIKTKVKNEQLAFCPSCDPNVVKFWKQNPNGLPEEA